MGCVTQVPHVNRTDYQLIDISEDGFVCSIFISLFIIPVLVNFSYECWFLTGLIAFFRWVCWLKMGTPRMIWSSQLMTICWPRLVSSCIFFLGQSLHLKFSWGSTLLLLNHLSVLWNIWVLNLYYMLLCSTCFLFWWLNLGAFLLWNLWG